MTNSKIRKIRRRRKLRRQRKIAFVFLILFAVVVSTFVFNGQTRANEKYNVTAITVESGDTLWKIAEKYKPDNKDAREFIYEISEFNKIENATILAGQTLYIPEA